MSRSDPAPAETVAETGIETGVETGVETVAGAAEASAAALFDAVLHPHRSLSPAGFVILMVCISAVSFATGIVFLLAGAWPIFGFFGLDVLLLYIAFRLNYRSGRLYETLHLTHERLTVQRVLPSGEIRRWIFQPYWVRVQMHDPPRRESRLTLSSHGQSLAIGSFLTPEERLEVARALSAALVLSRRPVHA
jgi:uncharacterized membrane protein